MKLATTWKNIAAGSMPPTTGVNNVVVDEL
jgi:hypothetical protein